jgi:hypothetical protein
MHRISTTIHCGTVTATIVDLAVLALWRVPGRALAGEDHD